MHCTKFIFQVADKYPELTINVGTGPDSPQLDKIWEVNNNPVVTPLIYEVEAQFIWIHWYTFPNPTPDKGFTGQIERI